MSFASSVNRACLGTGRSPRRAPCSRECGEARQSACRCQSRVAGSDQYLKSLPTVKSYGTAMLLVALAQAFGNRIPETHHRSRERHGRKGLDKSTPSSFSSPRRATRTTCGGSIRHRQFGGLAETMTSRSATRSARRSMATRSSASCWRADLRLSADVLYEAGAVRASKVSLEIGDTV